MELTKRTFLFLVLCTLCTMPISAQIVINEIQTSNCQTLADDDGEYNDWIELYNTSDHDINMANYALSDRIDNQKWAFPSIEIKSKEFLLVFASGKDKKDPPLNWRTVIDKGDEWSYSSTYKTGWRELKFDDRSWATGPSGFGYGDNDDATTIASGTLNIYARTAFTVDNPDEITKIAVHVDYDDAFIAFINGKEVARENIATCNSEYSEVTTTTYTDPILCTGGTLTAHIIDVEPGMLQKGENIFAVQGHNCNSTSSDLTLIPILSLASSSYNTSIIPNYIMLAPNQLHTNFGIKGEGESIYLFNNSAIVDSIPSITITSDKSYGRATDGASTWGYFLVPTPNATNSNALEKLPSDSIKFSARSGLCTKAFALILSYAESGCSIYYTTDCSEPTTQSTLYKNAFAVNKTTIIRAAAFRDGVRLSNITTKTFLFNTDHELPIVAINSEPKNFFDYYEGIFELGPNASSESPNYGANFWNDWEKPINIEYFDADGVCQINQAAGVKITGAYSRASAQKSMAIFARKKYGKNSFDYKFFHDRDNTSFKSFILRNSGNDIQYTFFRDGLVSEVAKNMEVDRLAFQPTVIYINGEYWGILNMREKPNEHYFDDNYQINPDSVSIAEGSGSPIIGSTDSYTNLKTELNSKTTISDDDYASICKTIDINSFIDYQLLEIFIYNRDWPGNNIKYWRANYPNDKWRWILYDTDYALGLYDVNTYKDYTLNYATTATGPDWPNPAWSTLLLRKLITNNSFKEQFITRFADCMNSNLRSDSITSIIDSLSAIIDSEMYDHLPRWWSWRNYNTWIKDINEVKTFVNNRATYMRKDIAQFFSVAQYQLTIETNNSEGGHINLNTLKLYKFPFSGIYFSRIPVDITAVPAPGYRFVEWTGGLTGTDPHASIKMSKALTIKAVFEPIPDDEIEDPDIVINEICFKSEAPYDSDDWVELYNNGTQAVNISGWSVEDAKPSDLYVIPEGVIIEPHDYLVVSCSKLGFKGAYPQKTAIGDAPWELSSTRDKIVLRNADSTEVDFVFYEPLAPWPTSWPFDGSTLELKDPSSDNEDGANWAFGIKGGTPGEKNSTLIVTSENKFSNSFSAFCYPTFFEKTTTLNFAHAESGKFRIEIVDLNGSVLETIEHNENDPISEIELFDEGKRNFAAGLYLVRLTTDKGSQVIRVIKKATK